MTEIRSILLSLVPLSFSLSTIGLFISCSPVSENESTISRPNIILIISDDQSYNDYSFMGHKHIETPRLDQLAARSRCFTRGYVTAPLCSPSLASILTGLYPDQHGITGNDPAFASNSEKYSSSWLQERKQHFQVLIDRFYQNPLLTTYLKNMGYRSLQTGKWWLGSWKDGQFDAGMTHGNPQEGGRHGDSGLDIGRNGLDTIIDFIDACQQDETPFFVWYAPFLPHVPHNPPDSLLQKYLNHTGSRPLAQYWAMCEWFDQTCGELMDYIDHQPIADETLIIYTGDNGWIQDTLRSNRYADRSKRSPYEGGIRTPLMLSWPGVIEAAVDSQHLVSNIDLLPTLLKILDLKKDDQMQGIDLLNDQQLNDRKVIFAEDFAHDIADIYNPNQSLQNRIALRFPYKLILPYSPNMPDAKPELYNLATDPDEQTNLISFRQSVFNQLKDELNQWWTPENSKTD